MADKILLGSHVSMKSPDYLLGSLTEALSYSANCFMIYTGPPQNTIRKPLEDLRVDLFKSECKKNNIDLSSIIVHAPYIVNLSNPDINKRKFSIDILKNELTRTAKIGAKYLVLHPGCKLSQKTEVALNLISEGINEIFSSVKQGYICLETMAGKGSEVGVDFYQLKTIIDRIDNQFKGRIGVCFDTCHLHDAGYNLFNFDKLLDEFDSIVGLSKLFVLHLNDSKNEMFSHKDRHANIGYGKIGFDILKKICFHKKLINVPKILETPYISDKDKSYPPYKQEIEMLLNSDSFIDVFKIYK